MNWLQRLLVRIAARFAPPLDRMLRSAGGAIEDVELENRMLREANSDRLALIRRERDEIREALGMSGGWRGNGHTAEASLAESSAGAPRVLKERLAELELALEDRGWKRQIALSQWEFSRYGIQMLILISRLYFIKNPLIRRGVLVSSHYVFGRGVEISSTDDTANQVLQDFFADQRNIPEVSHLGLTQKEETLHTDGNVFWVLFASVDDGKVLARTIDALEIQEIITDPDDASVAWFYHRGWTENVFDEASGIVHTEVREAWYVALDYEPATKLSEIHGKPVQKDTAGEYVRVLHMKVGGLPKWHFGCPLVYAALDWARAYKHFLEDWATITRALARFSWDVETSGGAPAIAGLKAALSTTLASDGGVNFESNPPPVVGSAWISGPGQKMKAVKTQGATTEPEQGRRVMLMVAAAFGLPETFFGDASTGSLATAQSLDRPTELKFLEAQERWRAVLQRIGKYALERSVGAPKGRLREAILAAKGDPAKVTVHMAPRADGVHVMVREAAPEPNKDRIMVDVKFPSILEHDIVARVNAIVEAMTLNGFTPNGIDEKTGVGLLLAELGVEDPKAILDLMYPEETYEPDKTLEPDPLPGDPNNPNGPQPPAPAGSRVGKPKRISPKEAQTARAIAQLRRAYKQLTGVDAPQPGR